MDHLAVRIQCAAHLHFLAFELLYLILAVNVVGVAGSFILEHILTIRLYHRTCKALGSRRLGGFTLSTRSGLPSLVRRWAGSLTLLLARLRLVWRCGLLR